MEVKIVMTTVVEDVVEDVVVLHLEVVLVIADAHQVEAEVEVDPQQIVIERDLEVISITKMITVRKSVSVNATEREIEKEKKIVRWIGLFAQLAA